jgi:hypothetical protein
MWPANIPEPGILAQIWHMNRAGAAILAKLHEIVASGELEGKCAPHISRELNVSAT